MYVDRGPRELIILIRGNHEETAFVEISFAMGTGRHWSRKYEIREVEEGG